jgi:N-acylneuraminate cytidylyltransferase/CMP-N,N'-diacetyllegionaminic acid synthase
MYLCTICARGGSKGVPGKNIRPLLGLPLIAHSIAQARATKLFSHIAISSDSDEILSIAKTHGADLLIKRPAEMATDTAGKMPAIAHAVTSAETMSGKRFDITVDLSTTAPLRLPEDIIASVRLLKETGAKNVITGSPSHCSPYFSLVETDTEGKVHLSKQLPNKILRRQDSPACYDMNGSIYVWQRDVLLADPQVFYNNTRIHIMPRERSLDIDEELDFKMIEFLMQRRDVA